MTENNQVEEIRQRIKDRNKAYIIETGRDLLRAKSLLGHGKFGDWLQASFKWSESTANNYMNAAKLADKSPEFGVLPPSAIVTLAAPNTPEAVKTEVANDIAQGKIPTHREVKAKILIARSQTPSRTTNNGNAAVVTLPVSSARKGADTSSDQDLVRLLQAAGLKIATAAFHKAFPSATVIDDAILVEPEAKQLAAA